MSMNCEVGVMGVRYYNASDANEERKRQIKI